MSQPAPVASAGVATVALEQRIAQLARDASIEINVPDARELEAARAFLAPGTRIYVSFLPKQTWEDTRVATRAVRAAGFEPVPHIPVRRIIDAAAFDRDLGRMVAESRLRELLLISGDYSEAQGPYSSVLQVMESGVLLEHGLTKVSLAGHPEGHPAVALDVIRRAERAKAALGAAQGLDVALVTQVVFEHAPLRQWAGELRADRVRSRIVAGLAGPASIATLFKFAVRCGAGASMRALGVRPGSLVRLLGDRGPEDVVRGLAEARANGPAAVNGIHLFCFGGFLRASEWLRKVADGRFTLDARASFSV
jgi:methylenetetrahydrofolate reductase (NADPH)